MYILYVYMYIPVLNFTKKKKKAAASLQSVLCSQEDEGSHLYLHFPCSIPRGLVSRQKRGGGGAETVPSQGG